MQWLEGVVYTWHNDVVAIHLPSHVLQQANVKKRHITRDYQGVLVLAKEKPGENSP
jgi:hypothetical protein